MNHILKIQRDYFIAVKEGRKNFEIRHDDRGFQAGDTVTLREYDGIYQQQGEIEADIGYVTAFQQHNNYVVFSLLNLRGKSINHSKGQNT